MLFKGIECSEVAILSKRKVTKKKGKKKVRSQRRRSLVANRLAGIIANNIGLLFLTLFTFSVL